MSNIAAMSRSSPDPLATTRLAARAVPPCGVTTGDVLAGRFRLGAVIGWGGQAVVFYAQDIGPRSAGPLAVKVVRTDLSAAARREATELLKWEAALLRRLRHPALPRLRHLHSGGGATWLARELVDGTPLSAILRQGPVDPARVRDWAIQLCALLRYLHTRTPPVICGDLKPANLVLRPDGRLTLIDLGAAQTRTRRPPRKARPHYGTPGYAAPEQLGGRGIDERSDVFSLAATCYELLTGIDPGLTPLVFDWARLSAAAPTLARALRPALAPDPWQRPPTAAALHATLARLPRSAPLALAPGAVVHTPRDLAEAGLRHPRALEAALADGTCERWLADHTDPALGALLHRYRAERRAAPRARALDALLSAMAPSGGSPLLHATPRRITFGDVPLRQTRAWSAPRRLTLDNRAAEPLRWELECPAQTGAELRVLAGTRPAKKAAGVLPPGGRAELDLVASGRSGPLSGEIVLRCGTFETKIPWEATGRAGIPVGQRVVARIADLDPAQPGLAAALEALARRGVLQRWLRSQRERVLADRVDAAAQSQEPLALTLAVGELLHRISPTRFPLIAVHGALPQLTVVAGGRAYLSLTLENRGAAPFVARIAPGTVWARCIATPAVVPAGGRCELTVTLAPPRELTPGAHTAVVAVRAGDLDLPLTIPVQVAPEQWWQRALRWLAG